MVNSIIFHIYLRCLDKINDVYLNTPAKSSILITFKVQIEKSAADRGAGIL